MDWDNLPEVIEARYLRGLKVDSDQRLKGFNMALLYGGGCLAIWGLMPYAGFQGWARPAMWTASAVFLYLSLRGVAVMAQSFNWMESQHD